ncbi:hypothetical protein IW140_004217 [Coemansia sp. RSA 1813]|nr:hypothetical protein EV178_004318 [Coemansia sp. RSA 1646]KAJ1769480.1 hypothetical protein LPJ74_004028 [Coemansia sp. RSA 1843]KAJ2088069.1 hypothetical protein IW138_004489 [Coemansia sp. RSA 986]KAJ2214856.1 hypothetical protein EV179_002666 [Coemansia sp. RSA 487]KAJ2568046.1 hypothetical protein IW140_004217 [Coemansia sp. RSA 1813]
MRATVASIIIFAAPLCQTTAVVAAQPACDSPIYCYGDLLHAVQMAHVYADDKTFVSKPTLKPVPQVLDAFAQIGGRNASKPDLIKFLDTYFGPEASELKPVDLPELDPSPPFLGNIKNKLLRAYGAVVNGYWKTLVRKQDLSILCDGCATSMLELKHPFVVPGGRFTEIYYWDTFFTMEGLLRSGLAELSKANILDLVALVDQYGFVPNGARNYYLDRSQPPFLTLMVKLFYEFTGDLDFVRQVYPMLCKEHAYWQQPKHTVNVTGVLLNRYNVDTDAPRPESYSEDYMLAHNVSASSRQIQAQVYADMATGAETGWDYSTRWVRDAHAPKNKILQGIRTRQIVPVELNAILYQVEVALAELGQKLYRNSNETPTQYRVLAAMRRKNMEAVFYEAHSGLYFDYLLDEKRRSTVFSPASLWPYWSFGSHSSKESDLAFTRLESILNDNPGGVPATLNYSGQQWDWPMAWPPLQYVMMQAALNTKRQKLAHRIAQSYVNSVFCAWYNTGGSIPNVLPQLLGQTDTGHMFEKFNSSSIGQSVAQSGEYEVQTGFGWTNGVLLWTLDTFGQTLDTPACPGIQFQIVEQPAATSSAPSAMKQSLPATGK